MYFSLNLFFEYLLLELYGNISSLFVFFSFFSVLLFSFLFSFLFFILRFKNHSMICDQFWFIVSFCFSVCFLFCRWRFGRSVFCNFIFIFPSYFLLFSLYQSLLNPYPSKWAHKKSLIIGDLKRFLKIVIFLSVTLPFIPLIHFLPLSILLIKILIWVESWPFQSRTLCPNIKLWIHSVCLWFPKNDLWN